MKKSDNALERWLIYVVLLIIIITVAVIRWHMLEIPLERDEGEYAYAAQLILQGLPPYEHLYSMKLPGVYAAYACIVAIFGQTHVGIHLGLLLVNVITIVLVFFVARRVADHMAGLTAAACFALLSLGQSVQGVWTHAENFVVLLTMGGVLLLLKGTEKDRSCLLFFSGLLMGTAFLMKQHGVAFIAFGGTFILADTPRCHPVNVRRMIMQCAVYFMGAVIPYGLTCLILALAGVFDKFWFWTVEYAMIYTSQVDLGKAWVNFTRSVMPVFDDASLIWMLAGFGLIALVYDKKLKEKSLFFFMFTAFSFIAICPGFYFRPHYFVMVLPAAALLSGAGISSVAHILGKTRMRNARYHLPVLLLVVCLSVSLFQQRAFLFKMTAAQACRAIYGYNPFAESLEISKTIRVLTKKEDRIAVIGSEPQIYFYTNRRSATGYIYMYEMMKSHDFAVQMQNEMIQEVESARPEVLVVVNVGKSWMMRPDSHELLSFWLRKYMMKHYSLCGLAEISEKETRYKWIPNVTWPPKNPRWVAVLKRKI